jgi:glyoxylase-like metal-dependent hydrolase (beta-lactamase superfamily II)
MPYSLGSHDLGHGCHAWLQPDGGWGLSNAGLIVGDGASLLVDTLFDLPLTRRMLAGFAPLTGAAPITTVVTTHGNGDHWFGNELVPGAEFVAAEATAADMRTVGPAEVAALLQAPDPVGRYGREIFGRYEFAGITPTYPTRTFERELDLVVGGVDVRLVNVGPAHTAGDTVVHVPAAGTVYTGDILFIGGTPLTWTGPLANWLRACQFLLDLDAPTIVPGHGPVTDQAGVREVMAYLEFVSEQATRRHAAGMSAAEAARDINLGRFTALGESERLAANVRAVYAELDPDAAALSAPVMFGCMAEHHRS